jgi:hypothetical protein
MIFNYFDGLISQEIETTPLYEAKKRGHFKSLWRFRESRWQRTKKEPAIAVKTMAG